MKRHTIEILESRIAPAVFFVNGTNLTVTDADGDVIVDNRDTAAEGTTGADFAVKLNKGDSLVFDLDGDQKLDAGVDFTMIKVTSGQATAFLEDIGGATGKFDADELTGVALGDAGGSGAKAEITGGVRGTVDTLLDD